MRFWTVYEPRHPASAGERVDNTLFIKDGFSWPGLIFSLFWLLFQRLWRGALIFVLLSVAIGVAGYFLPLTDNAGMLLGLLPSLYVGFEGNDMRRRKLHKKGFVQAGSVLAKSRIEAEEIFFTEHGAPGEPVSVSPRRASPLHAGDDALGFFPRPTSRPGGAS